MLNTLARPNLRTHKPHTGEDAQAMSAAAKQWILPQPREGGKQVKESSLRGKQAIHPMMRSAGLQNIPNRKATSEGDAPLAAELANVELAVQPVRRCVTQDRQGLQTLAHMHLLRAQRFKQQEAEHAIRADDAEREDTRTYSCWRRRCGCIDATRPCELSDRMLEHRRPVVRPHDGPHALRSLLLLRLLGRSLLSSAAQWK